jgi:hypothetical protein
VEQGSAQQTVLDGSYEVASFALPFIEQPGAEADLQLAGESFAVLEPRLGGA